MQVGASTKHQAAVGKLMAEKLNMATGPVVVIIPAERSPADVPKGAMPAAFKPGLGLKVFHKSLMRNLKPEVKVVRADAGESEPLFVEKVLSLFDEMMGIVSRG